jgi:hypothetical protein
VGNDLLVPKGKRGECIPSMLFFWVIAVLSVVGAFAVVWGLYLLVRRRL